MPQSEIQIRPYQRSDPIPQLTAMLHRAYGPLAKQGMRYLASHQDDAMTRLRLTERGAQALVALHNTRIVGTITLCQPNPDSNTAWYTRPDVRSFEQFAVDPDFQSTGIGSQLLEAVESTARSQGANELACDTSEHATKLIALYQRRGYRRVGHADWDVTNYKSIVLSRNLTTTPSPPPASPGATA